MASGSKCQWARGNSEKALILGKMTPLDCCGLKGCCSSLYFCYNGHSLLLLPIPLPFFFFLKKKKLFLTQVRVDCLLMLLFLKHSVTCLPFFSFLFSFVIDPLDLSFQVVIQWKMRFGVEEGPPSRWTLAVNGEQPIYTL